MRSSRGFAAAWGAVGALVLSLAPIAPACAEITTVPRVESRWHTGINLYGASSRGDLKDVFGTGFGIGVYGVFRLDHAGVFGLRLEGGMIDYGSETSSVPLSGAGPSVGVQIATKRNATTFGIGPQLTWPRGRFRPYAYATVGGAYFASSADLSGRDSLGYLIVLSADLNRAVWGAGGGGGATFRVSERISLDAGAEFRRYMKVRTIGDGAVELPNGAVFMTENRGDLPMVLFRAGVTLKLPAGGGRRGPHRVRHAAHGG